MPEIGQFWCKIFETYRGTIPKVKVAYVPKLCVHCDDAPCIPACPNVAIIKRPDGLVWIDPAKCKGSKKCLTFDACPYYVIYFNDELNIAQKCTGCAHLLDRKDWLWGPRCVDACIPGAMKFGDNLDSTGYEKLNPEFNLKDRIFYKNLPKRFIAGTIYSSATGEIIEGATCTLSGTSSGTAKTDGFGDFWFENLKVGTFSLKIDAGGKTKTIDAIKTDKDVNLGDIDLK